MMPDETPARPFAIGITPLGDRPWLVADERLPGYIDEKARLRCEIPDKVFMAEPGTEAAQAEALGRVCAWQAAHHAHLFEDAGNGLHLRGGPQSMPGDPPLLRAAMLCAEDLVIMRKGNDGWRIAAASLSFPSSWRLAEKFARPMEAVHEHVPGYAGGTRNATLVNRIFDNLQPGQPVLRGNWSIYGDDTLYHPDPRHGESSADPEIGRMVLREERQTLTRLPGSGDILFTILISLAPLASLSQTEAGRQRAATLASQLAAMDNAQIDYKSMSGQKAEISRLLHRIAAGGL